MRFLIYTKVSLRHVFDVCYVLRVENYVKYMGFRRVVTQPCRGGRETSTGYPSCWAGLGNDTSKTVFYVTRRKPMYFT